MDKESRIAELEERVHRLEGIVIKMADAFEMLRNLKTVTTRTVNAGVTPLADIKPTPWDATKLERGGASPGVTPPTRIDIRNPGPINRIGTYPAPKMDITGTPRIVTNITPCGRFRMYNTRTVPYAPTVEEMRAAKVDPDAPQRGQQVFTVDFGILRWDGERWRSVAEG